MPVFSTKRKGISQNVIRLYESHRFSGTVKYKFQIAQRKFKSAVCCIKLIADFEYIFLCVLLPSRAFPSLYHEFSLNAARLPSVVDSRWPRGKIKPREMPCQDSCVDDSGKWRKFQSRHAKAEGPKTISVNFWRIFIACRPLIELLEGWLGNCGKSGKSSWQSTDVRFRFASTRLVWLAIFLLTEAKCS